MPANALRVKERKFSTFEAVVDGQSVQIQGKYQITVENSGFFRAPSVTVSLSELRLPNGSIKIIKEEKRKSIGTLGGGQTGKVEFEFSVGGSSPALRQFAGTACKSQKPVLTTDETYAGLILAVASTGKVEIKSPSPSCSRAGGLPDQPEDVEPEEPPEDDEEPPGGGGEDPPTEDPPTEDPPTEDPPTEDPPAGGGEIQQVGIDGPMSPTVGEQATYSVANPPESASEYVWFVSGAPFDESSPADDNEYVATFDTATAETVRVDVRNDIGNQIAEGEITVNVQEDTGDGVDDPRDDDGEDDRDNGDNGDNGDTGNGGTGGSGQITGPEIVVEGQSNEWNYTGDLSGYNSQDHRKIWDMNADQENGEDVERGGPYTTGTINHTYDFPGPKTIEFRVESQFTDEVLESATYEITVEDSALGGTLPGEEPPEEEPPEEDPPEDDEDEGPDFQNDNLDGPRIVVEGEENTWSYESEVQLFSNVTWDMGDGTVRNTPTREITYEYDFQGPYNIEATATAPNGQENTEAIAIEVEPNVEDGPVGGFSVEPPSMSEAANNKEREY